MTCLSILNWPLRRHTRLVESTPKITANVQGLAEMTPKRSMYLGGIKDC